jgi:hypothetical protein
MRPRKIVEHNLTAWQCKTVQRLTEYLQWRLGLANEPDLFDPRFALSFRIEILAPIRGASKMIPSVKPMYPPTAQAP